MKTDIENKIDSGEHRLSVIDTIDRDGIEDRIAVCVIGGKYYVAGEQRVHGGTLLYHGESLPGWLTIQREIVQSAPL